MIDREQVMTWLETCGKNRDCSGCCPYESIGNMPACQEKLMEDAFALLKEQELKTGKWILDDGDANSWECSECGGLLLINDGTPYENDWYFCPYCGAELGEDCGQAVNWE